MRREDHGVAGLQREHAVAHRRRDRIRDGADGADDAHRLRDEHEVVLGVLADDAARLLALQAVPDDARLALLLEDLVLVVADAGLVDGHARERLGVVVDVLRHVAHDRVDLLLRERLVDGLRGAGLGDQLLDFVVGGDDGAFWLLMEFSCTVPSRGRGCGSRHYPRLTRLSSNPQDAAGDNN